MKEQEKIEFNEIINCIMKKCLSEIPSEKFVSELKIDLHELLYKNPDDGNDLSININGSNLKIIIKYHGNEVSYEFNY